MNPGDKMTITIGYTEPLCTTCRYREKTFDDPPCDMCSISEILYEPEEERECL